MDQEIQWGRGKFMAKLRKKNMEEMVEDPMEDSSVM